MIIHKTPFFLVVVFLLCSCNKDKIENICQDAYVTHATIKMYELVYDSLMVTDTSYTYYPIAFKTDTLFTTAYWKIFNKTYTGISLAPNFFTTSGNITVGLQVKYSNKCSIGEKFFDTTTNLQIYNRDAEDGITISPFVGQYIAYDKEVPSDTFRIAIDCYSQTRNPRWRYWLEHDKTPFYWISNFPRNFKTYTDDARNYPELSNGFLPIMSFKNMCLESGFVVANDNTIHYVKGYAHLGFKNQFEINYKVIDLDKYNRNKEQVWINKTLVLRRI
jgi:hypothetical protein